MKTERAGFFETIVLVYLHDITPQKTVMLIFTAVITSKLSDNVSFICRIKMFSFSTSFYFFPIFLSPNLSLASVLLPLPPFLLLFPLRLFLIFLFLIFLVILIIISTVFMGCRTSGLYWPHSSLHSICLFM